MNTIQSVRGFRNWAAALLSVAACSCLDARAAALSDAASIDLEGEYAGHLQDVWWDGGTNLWWAHTHQILRTDPTGRILAKADVTGHNAGCEVRDGRLYVAVCPMQKETGGKTTPNCHPTVKVYDSITLELLECHVLENLVDRTGSLAIMPDGSFVIGCLRPPDISKSEVRIHHLAANYRHLRAVVLPDVEVKLGVETIKYKDGELFLNMYKPGGGLLVVLDAATFAEKRRSSLVNGTTGMIFDGDVIWCGRTKQDKETGKYRSSLVRKEARP